MLRKFRRVEVSNSDEFGFSETLDNESLLSIYLPGACYHYECFKKL